MTLKNKLIFGGLLLLILLAFSNVFMTPALAYISMVYEKSSGILLIAADLKVAAGAGGSINVPVISGTFESTEDLINQSISYLEYINILLLGQTLLLSLSQSWLLKGLLVLSFGVMIFTYKKSKIAFHLLLVFLLVNPGLPIYINLVHTVAEQSQIKLGDEFHSEMEKIHKEFLAKEESRKEKLKALEDKQLAEAKAKGKEHISWLQKAEDWVLGSSYYLEDELSAIYKESLTILKAGSQKLFQNSVNLFVNVLLMFVLLPIGYLAFMRKVVPELLDFDTEEIFNELLDLEKSNEKEAKSNTYEKVES